MKLPDSYPPVVRAIAEHGYTAKSGNTAYLALSVEKPGVSSDLAAVIKWKRKPSPEDRAEIEQILSSQTQLTVGPDLNVVGAQAIFNAMTNYLEKKKT